MEKLEMLLLWILMTEQINTILVNIFIKKNQEKYFQKPPSLKDTLQNKL